MDRVAERILVVDDDPTVAEVVGRYLAREGYEVSSVADGGSALELVRDLQPDLLILDLMLPGVDGLEVCRRARALAPIPIIMLTARGREDDRVTGLELGADDYVAKPFSPRELTARVRSVLRRATGVLAPAGPDTPSILRGGRLEVDVPAREVRVDGVPAALTVREFELLAFLMANPNRVFTRQELLETVWGYTFGDTSTITVHVRRLREKVEVDPSDPTMIQTVWGVGYRFVP
jgi:DNA-binding response OmpR family regulator